MVFDDRNGWLNLLFFFIKFQVGVIIRNLWSFEKKSVKKRKAANRRNVELIFWLNRLIANQKREKIRFTDHKNVHLDMNFVFEKGPVCGVTFPSTGISGRNVFWR
jgi:hypothetical protein